MNTYPDGSAAPDWLACGVCGKLFDAEKVEKAVNHVLGHTLTPEQRVLLDNPREC